MGLKRASDACRVVRMASAIRLAVKDFGKAEEPEMETSCGTRRSMSVSIPSSSWIVV